MKFKFTSALLTGILLCFTFQSFAQTEGDYRSITSANWNGATTWERFTSGSWTSTAVAPSSTDNIITIRNGHNITISATVTADQVVIDAGGILTVNSTFNIVNGASDDLLNNGTLSIANALSLTGTLVNNSTINWSAGTISFADGAITNTGTFNMTGNNPINNTSGTNLLTNTSTGIITKNTGSGQTNIAVPITNSGTINVTSGTFRPTTGSSVVNTGTINITNSSTFSTNFVAMTLDPGTAITGTGILQTFGVTTINTPVTIPSGIEYIVGNEIGVGTGSLTINGKLTWQTQAIRIPVTIGSAGTLDITTNAAKVLNGDLVNNGTITWTDGSISVNTATITNNSTGIVNIDPAGGNTLSRVAGTVTLSNAGTINKLTAANTLTITSIAVTNTGTIKGVGTISIGGAGGSLTNQGTVAPGNSAGVLTINPSAVSSTSTTQIEILNSGGAGVGHDQLILSGSTTLTGSTLTVTDNAAAPLGVYTIMTTSSGTFSGTFGTVNAPANFGAPVISGNTVTIEKTGVTLPVVWGGFSVKAVNKQAQINWSTLQEMNTSHFVIEHSVNGHDFAALANVAAKGNSLLTTSYSYTHTSPLLSGTNFYRLKQVDKDGKSVYTEIFLLSFTENTAAAAVVLKANPLVGNVMQLNVQAKDVTVLVTDLTGRVLKNLRLQTGSYRIPVNELRAGIYQLSVYKNQERVSVQQFVKP